MPAPKDLLEKCIEIAREAGVAVMEIYGSDDFEVETKSDDSPLTKADKAANEIIEAGLKRISDYPIISEEGSHSLGSLPEASHLDAVQGSKEERGSRTNGTVSERQTQPDAAMRQELGRAAGSASRQGQALRSFWCVDPIDGTKEFIAKNGEFTINIGLVENGEPLLGVVFAPAQEIMYFGSKGNGAFKQAGDESPQKIEAKFNGEIPAVAVSRSHLNEATEKFLDRLGDHQLLKTGSSIKFCLVAEGAAALYPRLGPSHLWDTAAADAVLRAAGGKTEPSLIYDPAELINPSFVARAGNQELPLSF